MMVPGRLLGLRVVAAIVLLAILLHFVPPLQVATILRSSSPGWLLLAAVIVFAWRVIAAQRLRVFTSAQDLTVSSSRLYAVSLISSFFGTVTPGYAFTGVVRWYLVSEAGRYKSAALAALFNDRLTDLAIMFGMGLGGLLLTQLPTRPGLLLPAATLFVLLVASWFALGSSVVTAILPRLAQRLPRKLRRPAVNLAAALGQFGQMPASARLHALLLGAASNALNALGMYCLVLALDLPLSYYDVLWLRCAVFTAGTLPITIMGLGVREGMLIALLLPAGIGAELAVAFSLLILARELLAAAAGGIAMAFWRGPSPFQRTAAQS